jgi:CBS domain-containing protein
MTPDPACCTADMSLDKVATLMVDNDCGEIPVVDNRETRKPIGVVTDRDIVIRTVARGCNPLEKTAADAMTSPCLTVTPDMSLAECCDLMEKAQIRRVPVVDTNGRLCGIVALADIVQHAGRRTTIEVVKEVSSPASTPSRNS